MSEVPESAEIDDRTGLRDHPLTAARVAKLEDLREQGFDPYPPGVRVDTSAAEIVEQYSDLEPGVETDQRAVVGGRLLNVRSFGKLRFGVLSDATGTVQLFLQRDALGEELSELWDTVVDIGDWVVAEGVVMTTRKGELSVKVDGFQVVAKSLRPLPEKWHGLRDKERRFRQRYLDLIVNEDARRTAVARSAIVASLRETFTDRGFIEVETPMLQVQPGGALARPFVTHHNSLNLDMYLRVAPELYLKRLIVGGLGRVFEINRNFRNEGVDLTHNPEFTMLESYQAFADFEDVIELVEAAIPAAAFATLGATSFTYQGRSLDLTPPFQRATLLDLVNMTTGVEFDYAMDLATVRDVAKDLGIEPDDAWGVGKLITEVYERLVEPGLWDPIFVLEHPIEVSPLARLHRSKEHVVERFELFAGGMELANAFTELNDPMDQRRRFEAQAQARAAGDDEAMRIDEDYLRALEYGLPPTGGLGIGVDRIVMLLTDHDSIREVVLFPHLKPEESDRTGTTPNQGQPAGKSQDGTGSSA